MDVHTNARILWDLVSKNKIQRSLMRSKKNSRNLQSFHNNPSGVLLFSCNLPSLNEWLASAFGPPATLLIQLQGRDSRKCFFWTFTLFLQSVQAYYVSLYTGLSLLVSILGKQQTIPSFCIFFIVPIFK